MRDISPATQAALNAGVLVSRDFLRISGRNRETGEILTENFWSDLGEITAAVYSPELGASVDLVFKGVGALIAIDPIPMVTNLTVQRIEVHFSQLDDRINYLMRTYSIKQSRIEIYRGIFDPATMRQVEPAFLRFLGNVDDAPIETPAEGGEGSIKIACVSSTQQLTRSNTELRSDASQRERDPSDGFFKTAATAGDEVIFWGSRSGKIETEIVDGSGGAS